MILAVSRSAWEWWKNIQCVPKPAKAQVSCHFLTRRFLFQQQPNHWNGFEGAGPPPNLCNHIFAMPVQIPTDLGYHGQV